MTTTTQDKQIEQIKKKDWSLEDWKNSKDDLDRLVWFIAIQSPHNLWRARQALSDLQPPPKCIHGKDCIECLSDKGRKGILPV